uniref:Large ribosomal subunit protein uL22 n=1 Tax=candidate division CPR3 bacterium TaxID=2268181 RepID=A0A7V3N4G8_UNCC3
MEIKASARYVKTAPRKIRLVCDLIRGRKLTESIHQLSFLQKQAAYDVLNLLRSALANAKQKNLKPEDLFIKEIRCDEGPSLKRLLLGSRGRASQIKKRMSHIMVVLSDNRQSEILNSKLQTNSNVGNKKSKKRGKDA